MNSNNDDSLPHPLWKNTRIGDRTWLAGTGSRKARIMFIAPCVLEEEAAEEKPVGYGKTIPRTPRMLDSPHGVILKDIALRNGIDMDACYYTSIVRYLPEDVKHRIRPTKTLLNEGFSYLMEEIKAIKPGIIVCLGKIVFDMFFSFKVKESEIYGAWFYNKECHARIYPMLHPANLLKPEKHERFNMDLEAVKKMDDLLRGTVTPRMNLDSMVIHNAEELRTLTLLLEAKNARVLSVDCEWHGTQHIDGKLRSLQIAWAPDKAAYIRFMDDNLNYAFDVSYEEAGKILGAWCNRPEVKYIGHHVSADLPWMAHWLKLDWYDKAIFDTEFALQCCDESLDLGLDALALRFTDLGKYDWDLIWWKKNNPEKSTGGYGLIPDDIMIPYAIKDVIVVMRAYPIIRDWMEKQDLTHYYSTILNPFVTNVFTAFCLKGLPIDRKRMDEMRDLYNWARGEMIADFHEMVTNEAEEYLRAKLFAMFDADGLQAFEEIKDAVCDGHHDTAREIMKRISGAEHFMEMTPYLEHFIAAPSFNARSKPQMTRWLFDVKKYAPVKSTANKDAGIPAISWEKVMSYPPSKQAMFTPATDAQTLQILAANHNDATINALLELNSIGTVCSTFLPPTDVDPDTGKEVGDKGLPFWVASDDTIRLNHSCTETGRPRS